MLLIFWCTFLCANSSFLLIQFHIYVIIFLGYYLIKFLICYWKCAIKYTLALKGIGHSLYHPKPKRNARKNTFNLPVQMLSMCYRHHHLANTSNISRFHSPKDENEHNSKEHTQMFIHNTSLSYHIITFNHINAGKQLYHHTCSFDTTPMTVTLCSQIICQKLFTVCLRGDCAIRNNICWPFPTSIC